MRKRSLVLALAAVLLVGGGWLYAAYTAEAGCPAGCCHGPEDCPTPDCCAKK